MKYGNNSFDLKILLRDFNSLIEKEEFRQMRDTLSEVKILIECARRWVAEEFECDFDGINTTDSDDLLVLLSKEQPGGGYIQWYRLVKFETLMAYAEAEQSVTS